MNIRRLLLISAPVLVAAVSLYFYLSGERFVETDNAYLKADKVMIAPEVSAAVTDVLVTENQLVTKGQPLFQLDRALFTVALERARARQEKVRTDIEALQAAYRSKQGELALAQTNAAFAEKEYRRQADLSQQHFTSQIQLDSLHHSLDVARQQIAVIQQDIERLAAGLNHLPDAPVEQYPAYQEVAAELAQADINLEHATVYAPFDGVVSNIPKPGQHLNAGSPALALVANHALWIDANFNEIDLTHVRPGQAVDVHIDMYPDLHWKGKVASISPASGAEFSILPPQNASGNWVKVVQRIPVRIELESLKDAPVLRAGMSTRVTIDTGKSRLQRMTGAE
ncbi:MAG TPA: HlyD family secretion protein [Pseudomonadales bacterium]|nr:HlyD family secretion protein [Pseudomonadales bacterium]